MIISSGEMAKRLKQHKPEVVSTEDFRYKENRYLIHFDICSFYVVDTILQDALDKLADYMYMKEYFGLFYTEEEVMSGEVFPDEFIVAGNFCHNMKMPVLVEEVEF